MFSNGINMGRIMILLAFVCYAIKLKQGYKNDDQITKNFVLHVLRFLKEKISVWIERQGGWVSSISYYIYVHCPPPPRDLKVSCLVRHKHRDCAFKPNVSKFLYQPGTLKRNTSNEE